MGITDLPTELVIHILSYLGWRSHIIASSVCHLWGTILRIRELQKNHYAWPRAPNFFIRRGSGPVRPGVILYTKTIPRSLQFHKLLTGLSDLALWFIVRQGNIKAAYLSQPPRFSWKERESQDKTMVPQGSIDISCSSVLDDPVVSPFLHSEYLPDDFESLILKNVILYKPKLMDPKTLFNWRYRENGPKLHGENGLSVRQYMQWVAEELYEDEEVHGFMPRDGEYRVSLGFFKWGNWVVSVYPAEKSGQQHEA